jgi:hypothetical protein
MEAGIASVVALRLVGACRGAAGEHLGADRPRLSALGTGGRYRLSGPCRARVEYPNDGGYARQVGAGLGYLLFVQLDRNRDFVARSA